MNPNDNTNISQLSQTADANYKNWLQQLQQRLEKYRQLAVSNNNNNTNDNLDDSTVSKKSSSSKKSETDEKYLQMTRREIEVLAAYHCELQRMTSEQNERIESNGIDLEETQDLAERLQVEVEKKTGGGVSPRRKAKLKLRQEISEMRKKIDQVHSTLLQNQSELEGVQAEHAEVREFVSKQFFPVARVNSNQKFPSAQKSGTAGTATTTSATENLMNQEQQQFEDDETNQQQNQQQQQQQNSKKSQGFMHNGKQYFVTKTKAQELREEMMAEKRKGLIPGTSIRTSTVSGLADASYTQRRQKRKEEQEGNSSSSQNAQNQQQQEESQQNEHGVSYTKESSSRVKNIQQGLAPQQIGHITFKKKKIYRNSNSQQQRSNSRGSSYRAGSVSSMMSGVTAATTNSVRSPSPLSQERHARASADDRHWRANSLHNTTPTYGIQQHLEPDVYYGYSD